MVNVLLVGSGAREHCLGETIVRGEGTLFSYMTSNNPGLRKLSKDVTIGSLAVPVIVDYAKKIKADMAVIGPEAPLADGVVDSLQENGIPCFGPEKQLAQLETSKAFTRNLMKKYDIPGPPRFRVFSTMEGIREFIQDFPCVIKPDGLTGGKGVKVQGDHFQSADEALQYCSEVLADHPSVVIEEKLIGQEFSLQSFVSGTTVVDCPAAQDHKRAFEDDKGPNTGGMGSYSMPNQSLPFLRESDLKQAHEITEKTARALREETGRDYKGIMYGGFIATKDGVKLIEYNARFGDPEAMNVLPLLETNFVDICKAVIDGKLNEVRFQKAATVCKYAVPKGYPGSPVKGEKITVPAGARTYYAAVDEREGDLYLTGSRAIACVGIAESLSEAENIAEETVGNVGGPVFHRPDIGTAALVDKRIKHMESLR